MRVGIVSRRGALRTQGPHIVDQHGAPFMLRGVSLFWSQWRPQFYNAHCVSWLAQDWKINVIRAAMAVDFEGYLSHPQEELRKIEAVIAAAISQDIYVIVDWHAHARHPEAAKAFFCALAKKYKGCPNLILEIWNEPDEAFNWEADIRPYHNAIIAAIRKVNPDILIIAGTQSFSKRVDLAAATPLIGKNIAYAFHFYAASHKQQLRSLIAEAAAAGLPMIATEWGMCEADGDGKISVYETRKWLQFLEGREIGYLSWAISNKDEAASALRPGADPSGGWPRAMLSKSGRVIRKNLRRRAP